MGGGVWVGGVGMICVCGADVDVRREYPTRGAGAGGNSGVREWFHAQYCGWLACVDSLFRLAN